MSSDDMKACGVRPTGMWGTPIVSGTRLVRYAACGQKKSRFGSVIAFYRTFDFSTHASYIAARAHAAGRTPLASHRFTGGAR